MNLGYPDLFLIFMDDRVCNSFGINSYVVWYWMIHILQQSEKKLS